jgi:hypothetical protein
MKSLRVFATFTAAWIGTLALVGQMGGAVTIADDGLTLTNVEANLSRQETARQQDEAQVEMVNGQGKKVTLTLKTLPDSRGYQYCELVFNYAEKGSDIYSTSPIAQADLDWWDKLDVDKLAKEFGAVSVYKNGPQWWSMDEVGVMASAPVEVAGVEMVFGAHLPPGTLKIAKYTVFNPAKFQRLVWNAGKPVYQLVDPDGNVYVLQGHKIPTDRLATLGDQFKDLPDGWTYRVESPTKDLVMNLTPKEPIPSVQDEFDQIYIRIPASK